jgi:hypothetical protein
MLGVVVVPGRLCGWRRNAFVIFVKLSSGGWTWDPSEYGNVTVFSVFSLAASRYRIRRQLRVH